MFELSIDWSWVNPEAFSIGSLSIRWYGILYACAFIASYYAFKELLKFDKVPKDFADRALIFMILGTLIGARVGDCFFYNHEYYLKNPWEILYTWKGGLSSHGGAIGILTALFIFGRKTKKPYIWILDRVVIVIGVAGFFIRMGNLMNSEIYGHATDMPWGFKFNKDDFASHPTMIYEGLYYALTYFVLRFVYRKLENRPKPFLIFGLFLMMVFVFRFCIEFIKNDQNSELEKVLLETIGLNMGQTLSVPFVILGIIMLIYSIHQQRPAPLPAEQPEIAHVHRHNKSKPVKKTVTNHQQKSGNNQKQKKK